MKVYDGLNSYIDNRQTVLVLGMFDGMHKGHMALIDKAKDVAGDNPITVMTFANHFRGVKQNFPLLMTMEEKTAFFKEAGIESLIIQKVDMTFMDTTANDFIEQIRRAININSIIVGFDYTFGKGGAGGIGLLRENFKKVYVVDEVDVGCTKASSTRMRKAVCDWDYKEYIDLCGRPFSIAGNVCHGNSIGKENNTPTMNIPIVKTKLMPFDGVYMTKIYIDGVLYDSISNLGSAPTFNRNDRVLEIHVFDYNGNAYDKKVKVYFYKKVRDIIKFNSKKELYSQVVKDIADTKSFFKDLKKATAYDIIQ